MSNVYFFLFKACCDLNFLKFQIHLILSCLNSTHRAAQPAVPRSNAVFHGAMSCFAAFSPPCTAAPGAAKHCRPDVQGSPRVNHRSLARSCVSLYKSQHEKELSLQGKLCLTWTLCLFDGLWIRLPSYLNSASESVLLELFFLLHSPWTLMLPQTWSYRWCLWGSGKGMNPSVQKAVVAMSDTALREVYPESTLASTGCISKQGAEQAEPASLGGVEGQRQIEARSHTTTSCAFVQGIIQHQQCALHSLKISLLMLG